MPGPLANAQAAEAQQQAPQQGAPEQAPQEGQAPEGGNVTKGLIEVENFINALAEGAQQAGLPEQVAEAIQGAQAAVSNLVQIMKGGAAPEAQPQPNQGVQAADAAGNPDARPA